MRHKVWGSSWALVAGAALGLVATGAEPVVGPGAAAAQAPLVADGDFELNATGKQLRAREKPQGWYESRRNGKGRMLLKLSTKKIYGNATRKAMIKGHPEFNTYLSQRFTEEQAGRLSLQWDICVKEILPTYNRSAFQMIGNAKVRGSGPNATGRERFVFLCFENAETPGKINLCAFEGGDPWDRKTVLVRDLDLKRWYTIAVDVDVEGKRYLVSVAGVTQQPVEVRAFKGKGGPPKTLTHVSFASWNDGPGTFYVDNVRRP